MIKSLAFTSLALVKFIKPYVAHTMSFGFICVVDLLSHGRQSNNSYLLKQLGIVLYSLFYL